MSGFTQPWEKAFPWIVTMKVVSFQRMEDAKAFSDKLSDAFMDMPEADGLGAILDVAQEMPSADIARRARSLIHHMTESRTHDEVDVETVKSLLASLEQAEACNRGLVRLNEAIEARAALKEKP